MEISHLDHLVLTVADIGKACNFYSQVLNFEVISFGNDRKALKFGQQKINSQCYNEKHEQEQQTGKDHIIPPFCKIGWANYPPVKLRGCIKDFTHLLTLESVADEIPV